MIHKKIPLQIPYEKAGLSAEGVGAALTIYVTEYSPEIGRHRRPAVLICPGGGYEFLSDREAESVALAFLAEGIQAFVLYYSVVKKQFPTALLEAASAMAYIRAHAAEWDINPDGIAVCGFSAGGHLAASLLVHWNKPFVSEPLGFDGEQRPNAGILCYPVITTGPLTHQGSIDNITSRDASEEMLSLVTLERHVGPQTPPTFLWHCADDGCVPVENSLRFAGALSAAKIPFAMHIYPEGGHGLALANEVTAKTKEQLQPSAAGWFSLAAAWLKERFPAAKTAIE